MKHVDLNETNQHIDQLMLDALPGGDLRLKIRTQHNLMEDYLSTHAVDWQSAYDKIEQVYRLPETEAQYAANEEEPLSRARLTHVLGDQRAAYALDRLYPLHRVAMRLFSEVAMQRQEQASPQLRPLNVERFQKCHAVRAFEDQLTQLGFGRELAKESAKKFQRDVRAFLDDRLGAVVAR